MYRSETEKKKERGGCTVCAVAPSPSVSEKPILVGAVRAGRRSVEGVVRAHDRTGVALFDARLPACAHCGFRCLSEGKRHVKLCQTASARERSLQSTNPICARDDTWSRLRAAQEAECTLYAKDWNIPRRQVVFCEVGWGDQSVEAMPIVACASVVAVRAVSSVHIVGKEVLARRNHFKKPCGGTNPVSAQPMYHTLCHTYPTTEHGDAIAVNSAGQIGVVTHPQVRQLQYGVNLGATWCVMSAAGQAKALVQRPFFLSSFNAPWVFAFLEPADKGDGVAPCEPRVLARDLLPSASAVGGIG